MGLSDEVKSQIRESLRALHPEKVIVFGSYVRGEADRDSDIDLIVVLDSDTVPATYHERMMNRLLVRRALDDLNRDYALDVLVYTIPEWKRFQESDSAFAKEIASRGVEV
jgi:predicted nucleotidyltransferase